MEQQIDVSRFPVAETSLMKRRDLLRRVDTKFVIPADQLAAILDGLERDYCKLLANGASWATYETLYFDTLGEKFYHDHHRGRLGRQKIRIRRYVDRRLCYFEVKLKSNRRMTSKLRHRKDFDCASLDREDLALAAEVPAISSLEIHPRLWTIFRRLQLVGLEHRERITIDLGVTFRHGVNEGAASSLDALAGLSLRGRPLVGVECEALRGLAIVEVKQPRLQRRTPIMLALRQEGVRRTSLSKYCTGVVLTDTTTRAHRFMPKLKQIARLQCSSS